MNGDCAIDGIHAVGGNNEDESGDCDSISSKESILKKDAVDHL